MARSPAFLLLILLVAAPASAQDAPAGPPSLLELMDDADGRDLSGLAYANLPRLFFAGVPDTLLSALMLWDDRCGPAEPITRTLILGAIWDGDFSEDLYDSGIIDDLVWHANERRRHNRRGMKVSDLEAAGGVADVDLAPGAENFDLFTADLANQLLPHQSDGTLEQFFCLYYAGFRREALAMLEDGRLDDTFLQFDYDLEMEMLARPQTLNEVLVTNGYWSPRGDLTRAGGKYSLGVQFGQRRDPWFLRGVGEVRLGRADHPYWVDSDGISGYSDRWNAFSIGAEAGRRVLRRHRHQLDLFGGIAYDVVTPFRDEEFNLGAVNFSAGAGYRLRLGGERRILVSLDLRHEWHQFTIEPATPMNGRAWNVRLGLGWIITGTKDARKAALTP